MVHKMIAFTNTHMGGGGIVNLNVIIRVGEKAIPFLYIPGVSKSSRVLFLMGAPSFIIYHVFGVGHKRAT